MEYLLDNGANKWSIFVKKTQKNGAPRKYTGFQGRKPCIDARIGLGTECVSGEGLGEKRSDSWEVKEGVELSIVQEYEIDFLCKRYGFRGINKEK